MNMAKVSKKNLADALRKVQFLNIKEKELICDEIYKEQPNLFGSVIVQQRLGNSLEDIDVLLEILIVLHLSLKEAGDNNIENFRARSGVPIKAAKGNNIIFRGIRPTFVEKFGRSICFESQRAHIVGLRY